MSETSRGNKNIVNLTDYFSKWAEAAPLKDKGIEFNRMIPSQAWTDCSYKWTCDLLANFTFLHYTFYTLKILCCALPTCKLTEIEVSNIVYCMVMANVSKTKNNSMGVPNFMEGSLISFGIGDPRVPKILEIGDPDPLYFI